MGVWVVVKDLAAAVCTYICFELCCLIVGESFFPAYPAERCALLKWEGEGDVAYMYVRCVRN